MYNLKIIRCGEQVEVYKCKNYAIREEKQEEFYRFIPKEQLYKSHQLNFEESKQLEEKRKINKIKNRVDNLKKSKEKIIRLIKCNSDMSTFITLTFAKETDYKESKKCLKGLFDKLRRDYKGLKYLWVLEYGGENNRLHFHVLTNIEIPIKLNSSKERKSKEHKQLENEFKNRYWQYGIVDIRSLKQENNTNVALYVAKYVTKSMVNKDLDRYRIYGNSKNLNKPIIDKYLSLENIEDILKKYDKNYDLNYMSSYSIGYKNKKGTMTYANLSKKEC